MHISYFPDGGFSKMTPFSLTKEKNFHQKKFRKIMTFVKEYNPAIFISLFDTPNKNTFDLIFLSILKLPLLPLSLRLLLFKSKAS